MFSPEPLKIVLVFTTSQILWMPEFSERESTFQPRYIFSNTMSVDTLLRARASL